MSASGTKPQSIFSPRSVVPDGASVRQMTGRAVSQFICSVATPRFTVVCVSGAPAAYVTEPDEAVRFFAERATAEYEMSRRGVTVIGSEQDTSVFTFAN